MRVVREDIVLMKNPEIAFNVIVSKHCICMVLAFAT